MTREEKLLRTWYAQWGLAKLYDAFEPYGFQRWVVQTAVSTKHPMGTYARRWVRANHTW